MGQRERLVEERFGEKLANELFVRGWLGLADGGNVAKTRHLAAPGADDILRDVLNVEAAKAGVLDLQAQANGLGLSDALEDFVIRELAEPANDELLFLRGEVAENVVRARFSDFNLDF